MIDRRAALRPLAEIVECAFAAGADWLQVRDRELDGRALLALVCELGAAAFRGAAAAAREGADAVAPRILVNRRLDVALAARAALAHEGVDGAAIGVHLGFDAVGVAEARRLVGERALVGVSAHDADGLAAAAAAGADYAHLAPVFEPLSKPASRRPHGIRGLADALGAAPGLRVLAQGGIEARACGDVVRAGAAGVAVSGAVLAATDPLAAARALRDALDAAAAAGSGAGAR